MKKLIAAYRKVMSDLNDPSQANETIKTSVTFFFITLITVGFISLVVILPSMIFAILIFLVFSGFGGVILYGPCAVIYRVIREYLRHDNEMSRGDDDEQRLGS